MQSLLRDSVLAIVLLATACGHKMPDATPIATAVVPAPTPDVGSQIQRMAVDDRGTYLDLGLLPMKNTSLEDLPVPSNLAKAFWSGLKRDDSRIAEDLDPGYAHEKDTFKRQDQLGALAPKVQALFSGAAATVKVQAEIRPDNGIGLAHYDASKHVFPVSAIYDVLKINADNNWPRGIFTIFIAGLPRNPGGVGQFDYPVSDEATARRVESFVSAHDGGRGVADSAYRLFGRLTMVRSDTFTEMACPSGFGRACDHEHSGSAPYNFVGHTMCIVVDAIDILDKPSGQAILTMDADGLGKMAPLQPICTDLVPKA